MAGEMSSGMGRRSSFQPTAPTTCIAFLSAHGSSLAISCAGQEGGRAEGRAEGGGRQVGGQAGGRARVAGVHGGCAGTRGAGSMAVQAQARRAGQPLLFANQPRPPVNTSHSPPRG